MIKLLTPIRGAGFYPNPPLFGDVYLGSHDVTHASAVVAICWINWRCVVIQRAAGTVEVLGLGQSMQEAVHQGRIFDLSRETELGLVEAHLAPAVALPIGVLPLPVTSVVLTHHLGLAVTVGGRHRPLDHCLVDHGNRDCEVSIGVVTIRDIRATLLLHDLGVARNTDELGPCGGIFGAERAGWLVSSGGCIEASGVDVVAECVVTDDAVDTQLEAGEASVEVGVGIPVTVVALGLEVKRTANARIRDNDVKELHASGFSDVETESVIFVLEVDEGVIEQVEREVSNFREVSNSELNTEFAEVVSAISVFYVVAGGNEPSGIVNESAVGSVIRGNAEPLVSSTADVVGAEELFVDVLGDASIALLELKDFFSGEEAIEKALNADPVSVHLFTEKLESVALSAGTLNDFAVGGAGIGFAVSINDLAERAARIMESTAKAEGFLLGGVIEGPRLLLETGEVRGVSDELLNVEVVEILTSLAEKAVQLGTRIELNHFCHNIFCLS